MVRGTIAILLLIAAAAPTRGQSDEGAVTLLRPLRPLQVAVHPSVELDRLTPLLDHDATFAQLRRAAELTLDLAVLAEDTPAEQARLLRQAESYALDAISLRPNDLDAQFLLGAAMGVQVQYLSAREKMRTANEIHAISKAILERDATHAGGLHLRGQLNAAAMRLGTLERFVGRTFFGADLLGEASWEEAERAFRGAIEAEPQNPCHRWELARLLDDTGRDDQAVAELRRIIQLPGRHALLAFYRHRAEAELDRLID